MTAMMITIQNMYRKGISKDLMVLGSSHSTCMHYYGGRPSACLPVQASVKGLAFLV